MNRYSNKKLLSAINLFLNAILAVSSFAVEDGEIKYNHIENIEGIYSNLSNIKKPYVVYAEAMKGKDWGERINKAIDEVEKNWPGGEVVLPSGQIKVSTTIDLAGTKPTGWDMGVVLRGPGGPRSTDLIWEGPENKPVIEMASPWFCQVRNIGIDGKKTKGVIGIRFRAGWERGPKGENTARQNLIEGVCILDCDIGMQIGDYYSPDLASHNFRDIWVRNCRVGFYIVGANVGNLWFYGITISGEDRGEIGFKLEGSSGFQARSIKDKGTKPPGNALRDTSGNEVFFEEVPIGARILHNFGQTPPGNIGGGNPELVVYGLAVHMSNPKGWVIETNWAPIRIYSARMEGDTPLLRFTQGGMGNNTRFNVVFVDVSSVSPGNEKGNVIEYNGGSPLHLIACNFNGNVACGNTDVFSVGTNFYYYPAAKQEKFQLCNAGFVPLFPGASPRIHQSQDLIQLTAEVPAESNSVKVPLAGVNYQVDGYYQVVATPRWNAGGLWVSNVERGGFVVNFNRAPEKASSVDIMVSRPPYQQTTARQKANQTMK